MLIAHILFVWGGIGPLGEFWIRLPLCTGTRFEPVGFCLIAMPLEDQYPARSEPVMPACVIAMRRPGCSFAPAAPDSGGASGGSSSSPAAGAAKDEAWVA